MMRCGETTSAASGPVGCGREPYWEPEGLPQEGQGPFTRHPTGGDLCTELMTAASRPQLVHCPRWFMDYSASVELQPHTPVFPRTQPVLCAPCTSQQAAATQPPRPGTQQSPLFNSPSQLSARAASHSAKKLGVCLSVSFSPSLPRLNKNSFW